MNKKNLSEDDTSAKFITPARYKAGGDEAAIRRQVAFAAGRIIVRGKAKHNFKAAGDGMQQALDYATTLDSLSSSPAMATALCCMTTLARQPRWKPPWRWTRSTARLTSG